MTRPCLLLTLWLLLPSTALAAPGEAPRAAGIEDSPPYDLRPFYLGTPEIVAAYDLFKDRRARDAASAMEAALTRVPDDAPARRPLLYLAAEIERAAGRYGQARAYWTEVAREGPLADRANFQLGVMARRSGDVATAARHFDAVGRGGPDFPNARQELAELRRREGRRDLAAAALEEAVDAARSWSRPNLLLALAEDLAATGRDADARERLRELWYDHPESRAAARAERLLAAWKEGPTQVARMVRLVRRANPYNADALMKRLTSQRRSFRGREASALLAYGEGVVLAQRRGTRRRALKAFERAWKATEDDALRGHLLLAWADALEREDDLGGARDKLVQLVDGLPTHAAVGEGRLMLAAVLLALRDGPGAMAALHALGDMNPRPSLAAAALWQLGWLHYKGGQHDEACRAFAELAERFGRDDGDGGASTWGERAGYWRGRALEAAGRREDAAEAWAEVVATWPLTYYSHLAWNRLRAVAPARAAELRRRSSFPRDPLASPADLARLRIARAPQLETAVALVRVGLYDEARRDLEYRLSEDALPPDGLVLAGALHLRTGDIAAAHRLMRRHGRFATYPDERSEMYWKLAYPVAFLEVAAEYAGLFEMSPWLVLGLVRHESAFRTEVRSFANAIGLMQLLPATARRVAERLLAVRPPTARGLANPAMNLLVGSRFLRELTSLFEGNLVLAVSAYNAGPGRVKGWLRELGPMATDEFLEVMPYSSTASYTKKVLASYSAYCFLYGDPDAPGERGFELPERVPETLGPYMVPNPAMRGPEAVPRGPVAPPPEREAKRDGRGKPKAARPAKDTAKAVKKGGAKPPKRPERRPRPTPDTRRRQRAPKG